MKLVDLDRLKWPDIAIFDMNLHGECVPMVRLSDLQALAPLAPLEDVVLVEHGQWQEHRTRVRGYGKVWYQHCCTPLLYESPYKYCPNCGAKMEDKRNK